VAKGIKATNAVHLISEIQPDELVVDVNFPKGDGIDVDRHPQAHEVPMAISTRTITAFRRLPVYLYHSTNSKGE